MSAARLARIVVQAMVIGLGIGFIYWSVVDWSLADAGAYWEAAMRIRTGEPLYPVVGDVESSEVYRYSPWFAWAAMPFTFLPIEVAGAIWSLILVAASIAAVIPLARRGSWLAVVFFGPILIGISANGNVHALMIASLVYGLERRSGPLWIAAAASLKAVPILLALVYLGRREWGRFAATVGLTVLLVSPFLLYDLSNYVTSPGLGSGLLVTWPVIYVAAGVAGVVATLWLASTRFSWLAAAVAVSLALPRFFVYDVTFVLLGTVPAPSTRAPRRPPSRFMRRGATSPSTTPDEPSA